MNRIKASRLFIVLAAGLLVAACQTTNQGTAASGATSGSSPVASQALNKDWGSCAYRNCGYGR